MATPRQICRKEACAIATLAELYENLKAITQRVLGQIAERGLDTPVAVEEEGFVRGDDDQWRIGPARSWRAMSMPHEVLDEYLPSLDETESLVQLLCDRGLIQPPALRDQDGNLVEDPPRRSVLWFACLRAGVLAFVQQFLRDLDSWQFDEELFDRLYQPFEDYHVADDVAFTATIPVLGLASDEDVVEFAEGVTLTRLHRLTQTRLAAEIPPGVIPHGHLGVRTVSELFASGFAIKVQYTLRKDEPASDRIAREEARRIVTALRLLKPGRVSWNIVFAQHCGFHPHLRGASMGHTVPLLPTKRGEPLVLSAHDVEPCKDLWRKLAHVDKALEVGIRKFSDLYERRSVEDKIIDMAILLESTLGHGLSTEIRFRLPLRGARLLAARRDPLRTRDVLKVFYDIRSGIVHGGARLDDFKKCLNKLGLDPAGFVREMESICREVLQAMLDEQAAGRALADCVERLDKDAATAPAASMD